MMAANAELGWASFRSACIRLQQSGVDPLALRRARTVSDAKTVASRRHFSERVLAIVIRDRIAFDVSTSNKV